MLDHEINLAARLSQAKLATEAGINHFVKATDFDKNNLKNISTEKFL